MELILCLLCLCEHEIQQEEEDRQLRALLGPVLCQSLFPIDMCFSVL